MSDYTPLTDFSVKDGLAIGDPNKKAKGEDIDAELDAIATAIISKADDGQVDIVTLTDTQTLSNKTLGTANNTITIFESDISDLGATIALKSETALLATQAEVDLKATIDSPLFTGNPRSVTMSPGDDTIRIATTAFVQTEIADKADLDSPALTGNPTAPTATTGDSDTSIATTAFVQQELLAVGVPALAGKLGATVRTSTTTLTADPDLQLPVVSGVYAFEGYIEFSTPGAAVNLNLALSVPSPVGSIAVGTSVASSGSTAEHLVQGGGGTETWTLGAASETVTLALSGKIQPGASGTFSINWAQDVSNASPVTLLAGSWIRLTKIS